MHGIKRREWTKELIRQKRETERQEIIDYRNLTNTVLQMRNENVATTLALQKTSELLNWNPEFNTIWNYRRAIIKALFDDLGPQFWNEELEFTMKKLKVRPKVYWIWSHRVWCLENYPNSPLEIWSMELAIVGKLLQMDSRNFHGWHYRRFVVKKIELLKGIDMNWEEFDFTTSKINQNISNFSAWFQRASLFSKMVENNQINDLQTFIKSEFEYIINAMFTDAEDQSVWTYIKWFISNDIVINHIKTDDYKRLLNDLTENIRMINEDEVSFSGKDNVWCLKTLIAIESIQTNQLHEIVQPMSKIYLEKLILVDPLRKNRYFYQLNAL